MDRRAFIVSTSAAAIGAAAGRAAEAEEATKAPRAFRSPAGGLVPYRSEELFRSGAQRTFTGDALKEIAFPLGGIGTGTVSLGGGGQLRDWEIFNRPAKGRDLALCFFALWAKPEGAPAVAHVLERRRLPPFVADRGLSPWAVAGLPRLEEATFTGSYPIAQLSFHDSTLPVEVELEAFSPFAPPDDRVSGMPVAV